MKYAGIVGLWVVCGGGLVFMFASLAQRPEPALSAPAPPAAPVETAAAAPPQEPIGSRNLVTDAAFKAENPHIISQIRSLIDRRGYDCPKVSALWNKGESPLGTKLEVLCGPADNSGDSISTLHYAVYTRDGTVMVCAPFEIGGRAC